MADKKLKVEVAGVEYDKEGSMQLRAELIKLRDDELKKSNPDFAATVLLSHTIGWMWAMVVENFGGSIEELAPKRNN